MHLNVTYNILAIFFSPGCVEFENVSKNEVYHLVVIAGINPLHAKIFTRKIITYLQFISSFHDGMTRVVEILPGVGHWPTYFT